MGLLGAVELVPLVVFGLYGGALADRRLMFAAPSAGAVADGTRPADELPSA